MAKRINEEELIKPVNAWRCRRCGGEYNSKDMALKCANQGEVVKPLPKGFVYVTDAPEQYFLVVTDEPRVNETHDSIVDGFLIQFSPHSEHAEMFSLTDSSREVRGNTRMHATDEQLERVRRYYEGQSIAEILKLPPKDLTNKLD